MPLSAPSKASAVLNPQSVLGYVTATPFCPFRLHAASVRTFEVRHPEMIKVLKSRALIFKSVGDAADIPDEWESVSLMLTETVSHLDPVAH